MVNRTAALVAISFLAGCGGGGGGGQPAAPAPNPAPTPLPTSVDVRGAVQKGPFLVGSTVLINRLDNMGRPTASTIVSQVEDSVGSFDFVSTEPGPVQIVASGYYFSELTGQISNGTLTLRALYQLTNQPNQSAYVNMLTHLINDRALQLVSGSGKTFSDAITQAESELLAAFQRALPVTGITRFSGLNIYHTSGSAAVGNVYLLALSTAFYKYAANKAAEFGTATDAELTLILNTLSADLATDGDIDTVGFVDDFIRAVRSLSPAVIADNLRSRSLVDYPQGLSVPDISAFLSLCAGDSECAWRAGAPMPTKPILPAIAALDGKVYVFGGVFPSMSHMMPTATSGRKRLRCRSAHMLPQRTRSGTKSSSSRFTTAAASGTSCWNTRRRPICGERGRRGRRTATSSQARPSTASSTCSAGPARSTTVRGNRASRGA
jgi:hypothetical protein